MTPKNFRPPSFLPAIVEDQRGTPAGGSSPIGVAVEVAVIIHRRTGTVVRVFGPNSPPNRKE